MELQQRSLNYLLSDKQPPSAPKSEEMKITVRLEDAEITVEQRMDLNMTPALARVNEKELILDSIKQIVNEVIRLKAQKL